MIFKDLENLLEEIPILLVPKIEVPLDFTYIFIEGMAISKTKPNQEVLKCTILNYHCDNIANGLFIIY